MSPLNTFVDSGIFWQQTRKKWPEVQYSAWSNAMKRSVQSGVTWVCWGQATKISLAYLPPLMSHNWQILNTWAFSLSLNVIFRLKLSNLRSGSIFVSLGETFRREGRNEKPPTFLIDWHSTKQPIKICSACTLLGMQISHNGIRKKSANVGKNKKIAGGCDKSWH